MESKSKTNRAEPGQKSRTTSKALTPEIMPAEPASETEKKPVKTVTGHRLVEKKEKFVIDDGDAPANGAELFAPAEDDGRVECQHCDGLFRSEAFDERDGHCPGCGLDEDGFQRDAEPAELSEAEMLLQSIANDDEYSIRVDRLVNYDVDHRTDSRAPREFCTTLKPVTLDYLDVVRRSFGGGTYFFSMYKKGRAGFVRTWHESIAKPMEPIEPIPVRQNVDPSAERKQPIEELRESFMMVREFKDVLGIPSRPAPPAHDDSRSLPASNPATELSNAVTMVKSVAEVMKEMRGDEAPPARGGDGGTLSSLLNFGTTLIRELHIGEVVGPLLAGAVAQRMNQGGGGAPVTQPPPAALNQPAPPTPAQLAMLRFVRGVAADMSRSDGADALMDVGPCVEDTLALVQKFPEENKSLINDMLSATPREVVQYIATLAHDETLPTHAPAELWAADYQQSLRDESEASMLLKFPALVTEPAASEPPAKVETNHGSA